MLPFSIPSLKSLVDMVEDRLGKPGRWLVRILLTLLIISGITGFASIIWNTGISPMVSWVEAKLYPPKSPQIGQDTSHAAALPTERLKPVKIKRNPEAQTPKTAPTQLKVIPAAAVALGKTGDTYNTNATAPGAVAIGHVEQLNIGKQVFQLTPTLIEMIISATPKDKPVVVESIGSSNAIHMGNALVSALKESGREVVGLKMIAIRVPLPEQKLSIRHDNDITTVTISPDS